MTTDRNQPCYRGYLSSNTVTLAEVLKASGYRTAMSGKWPVSNNLSTDASETNDLAAANPEIVTRLSGQWNAWAKKHHVLPKKAR